MSFGFYACDFHKREVCVYAYLLTDPTSNAYLWTLAERDPAVLARRKLRVYECAVEVNLLQMGQTEEGIAMILTRSASKNLEKRQTQQRRWCKQGTHSSLGKVIESPYEMQQISL